MEVTMQFLRRVASGATAGIVAGIAVAIFYLVVGAVRLQPFAVPVTLSSELLRASNVAATTVTAARMASLESIGAQVLTYTVLHLLTFAAVGVVAAFVLDVASFWLSLLGGVAYGSVVCTAVLYASGWVAATPIALHSLGLRSVLLANAMAGGVLGLALHLEHQMQTRDNRAG
jgi:hypothetical protein